MGSIEKKGSGSVFVTIPCLTYSADRAVFLGDTEAWKAGSQTYKQARKVLVNSSGV